MPYLHLLGGQDYGQVFLVDANPCTLGREEDCDIFEVFKQDPAVSRHHARITRLADESVIEDLKSRNGTFLNGWRVDMPTPIRDGDLLAICNFQFLFRADAVPGTMPGSGYSKLVDNSPNESILANVAVNSSFSLDAGKRERLGTRYEVLLTLLSQMGRSLELSKMLDDLLAALLRLFPQADRGFVGLRSADQALVPAAIRYRNPSDSRPILISRRIVDRVVRGSEAILLTDSLLDSSTDSDNSIADSQIRSVICAPLLSEEGNSVLGVVQIDCLRTDQPFQPEDLQLLAALTPQAAFAVRVAQLHRTSIAQAAVERDLQLAARVQASLLPVCPPVMDEYELFAHYRPARHVGGDYYDYLPISQDCLAIVLADVAGKGVAAALVMAELRGLISQLVLHETSPTRVLEQINCNLAKREEAKFVTLILALLNCRTHEVVLMNAGHLSPYCRRVTGEIESLGENERGMILGIDTGQPYQECRVQLRPGDLLAFFTDGITDAVDGGDERYGEHRLRIAVQQASGSAAATAGAILNDVDRFVGDADQADDMCLVLLRRLPSG